MPVAGPEECCNGATEAARAGGGCCSAEAGGEKSPTSCCEGGDGEAPVAARGSTDAAAKGYTVGREAYRTPSVMLTDQNGRREKLTAILDGADPVALNFIFTTCTTICPVMTGTFAGLQKVLGDDLDGLRLVSVTLDPQYDSPAVLKRFATRYGAGPRWRFLTGDAHDLDSVWRAFHAVEGTKFNHKPFTLLKMPGDPDWVRIDGLPPAGDLADEYRKLKKAAEGGLHVMETE